MSWWDKLKFWQSKTWIIKFTHGATVSSIRKPRIGKDGMIVICNIPGTFRYREETITCSIKDVASIDVVRV